MAFKPNYRLQRGDRDRVKAQKKQEKLQRRDDAAAKRRTERDEEPDTAPKSEAEDNRSQ